MKILGIETSFDETAAAVVENGKNILSNVVASSAEIHIKYGGVVPEVAARKQIESMVPVLTEAMIGFTKDDIDAIAVTIGPGLIGSLLVGVETAKTLALAWNKPVIPVNHVLAHIYGVFLEEKITVIPNSFRDPHQTGKSNGDPNQDQNDKKIKFPAIALVVSGAHTELYFMKNAKSLKWLGGTLDDAAGECFDKCARVLGLPYPGGPEIAAEAEKYQNLYTANAVRSSRPTGSDNIRLPRPMINDKSLNFSFSGLKTAVLREYKKLSTNPQPTTYNLQLISAFSYEIQETITDVLVNKTLKATSEYNISSIIVTGGVAANHRLSHKFNSELLTLNSKLSFYVPPPHLCVDSASYIAAYAYYHNQQIPWKKITARPDLSVEI